MLIFWWAIIEWLLAILCTQEPITDANLHAAPFATGDESCYE